MAINLVDQLMRQHDTQQSVTKNNRQAKSDLDFMSILGDTKARSDSNDYKSNSVGNNSFKQDRYSSRQDNSASSTEARDRYQKASEKRMLQRDLQNKSFNGQKSSKASVDDDVRAASQPGNQSSQGAGNSADASSVAQSAAKIADYVAQNNELFEGVQSENSSGALQQLQAILNIMAGLMQQGQVPDDVAQAYNDLTKLSSGGSGDELNAFLPEIDQLLSQALEQINNLNMSNMTNGTNSKATEAGVGNSANGSVVQEQSVQAEAFNAYFEKIGENKEATKSSEQVAPALNTDDAVADAEQPLTNVLPATPVANKASEQDSSAQYKLQVEETFQTIEVNSSGLSNNESGGSQTLPDVNNTGASVKPDAAKSETAFNDVMAVDQNITSRQVSNTSRIIAQTPVRDSGNVLNQVINQLRVMVGTEKTEMFMTLSPENLGRLSLKLVSENGAVVAQFMAQNQQVKEILESNISQLRLSLEEQGLKVGEISVSVQDDNRDGFSGANFGNGNSGDGNNHWNGGSRHQQAGEIVSDNYELSNKINPYEVSDSSVDYTA